MRRSRLHREDRAIPCKSRFGRNSSTGVLDRGIPPCVSCHGTKAEGVADFPRLARPHAKYVMRQIEYIQGLVRKAPVMHGIVNLTHAEIDAVATYVQSL